MQPVEIMEDLFFIQRGYLNGNHFVYRSDEPILIDTAYISDFESTEALIAYLGVTLARTQLIINTHCHCDHIGGNRIIQSRSACDIALHAIGKHFITTRDDWATWWKYYGQEADFFTCTKELNDGDTVAIGPHEFRVIHTPGHASDGIVLYNEKEEVLLSSDTLWERDMAVMTTRVEGSAACFAMLESLQRLEKLEVKVVYPGHGSPFEDMPAAISSSKTKLKQYMGDRTKIGDDLLKRIVIYTLLMKRAVNEASFFEHLMSTHWFKETIDLYFDSAYQAKYESLMKGLLRRGVVKSRNGKLVTTVKP